MSRHARCSRPGLTPRSFSPRKEKQLQKKLDNMKPKHPEEQEIPFRLRELMRSREAMKRPGPGKRRAAGGVLSPAEEPTPLVMSHPLHWHCCSNVTRLS